jgi:hypothetical protein
LRVKNSPAGDIATKRGDSQQTGLDAEGIRCAFQARLCALARRQAICSHAPALQVGSALSEEPAGPHLPKKYIALDFDYAQSVVSHIFLRPSPRIAKAKKQLRVLTTQYGRISDYEF